MKLLFRQRFFSWLDSYDIFDDAGNTVFTVKGELSLGHRLRVFDAHGNEQALLQEKLLHLLPTFEIYLHGSYAGRLRKEFTLFRPSFSLEMNNWRVEGSFLEWDYTIRSADGSVVASVSKELFRMTDTYVIDVPNPGDALGALLVTLAIDAEKCSRG